MSRDAMKVLLVGPYPPPHGGISVHVSTAHLVLSRCGAQCEVLDPRAKDPSEPRLAAAARFLRAVRRFAADGFTLHVHENGHSCKSLLLAFACAVAGSHAPARILTLHSGMVPAFLARGRARRAFARMALRRFDRILCVSAAIKDAVAGVGIARDRLDVVPAFLPVAWPASSVPRNVGVWMAKHDPVVSTALFFRPEYGFDVLLEALTRLKVLHPRLGCLVMGSGEDEAEAHATVRRRGMDEWVFLAGDVPHDLCLRLMARSDLFVRATLTDGDALSVREALALDVPVVASEVGFRPAGTVLFRAGDAGALVEAAECALSRYRPMRLSEVDAHADGRCMEGFLRTYREIRHRN